MNVRVAAETATVITVEWDPVAGQEGYVATLDGSDLLIDGKRHFSGSKTAAKVRIGKPQDGKPHAYGVRILGALAEGTVTSPAPVSEPAPAASVFGISLPFGPQEAPAPTHADLEALGVKWLRVDANWAAMEPSKGSFSFDGFADWTRSLEAHGISVLPILDQTPSWARAGGSSWTKPNDPADYGRFVAAFVDHFRPGGRAATNITAYELWNEPNNGGFWPTGPNPADYVALVNAALAAVERPGVTIVAGATSPHGVGGNYTDLLWPPSFIEQVVANCDVDAVSHHPYNAAGYGYHPDSAWSELAESQPKSIRSVLVAHGKGDLPIWGTEWGFEVPDWCDEATAAARLTEGYQRWRAFAWPKGPLFHFTYRSGAATGDPGGFSLIDPTTGKPRARYAAYKQAATG